MTPTTIPGRCALGNHPLQAHYEPEPTVRGQEAYRLIRTCCGPNKR